MKRSSRRGCAAVWCVLSCFLLGFSGLAGPPPPRNYSVQVGASIQESRIVLSWIGDTNATGYRVSLRSASGWEPVADVGGSITHWSDESPAVGEIREYQIIKSTSAGYRGIGYISTGIRVPFPDSRGKLILLVENSVAAPVAPELDRLRQDLAGDGWEVVRKEVSLNDSPQSVKEAIQSIYDSDPANVKAVLLFGHVPVPYSGNIAPDGHENHRGAWPADVFYGDMDGLWTDTNVNTRLAERPVNWNLPGDGRYDPSVIPSAIELMVGRIDFSNLTCYSNKIPPRSEVDLLRQYLNKNHSYRVGNIDLERRALVCDNFSDKGEDPIGGSAWRNFPPLVGATNIIEVPWNGFLPEATRNSYLWSFASGGGSYYYSSGVATSDDFATNDLKIVFAMFMGSYFGDWNNESNFLRASLGSGQILAATYSGFPQSLYFPMGLGETIGHCIRLTQNNLTNTIYAPWDQGQGEVHVALMGDPTLRLYPVKPASNLSISNSAGTLRLTWTASPDSGIEGYHVYRATQAEGPFMRISPDLVASTSFDDSPGAGSYTYMLRAVKLEESPSGTYLNPSQGIFANVRINGNSTPLSLTIRRDSATQFVLGVAGDPGQTFHVESSQDLREWVPLAPGVIARFSNEIPMTVASSNNAFFLRTVNTP